MEINSTDQQRLEQLTEEVRRADAGIGEVTRAIAQHVNAHRDLRTCRMEGRIYHLVGGSKDDELLRLEADRNRLLTKFHGLLAEQSALKQTIKKKEVA